MTQLSRTQQHSTRRRRTRGKKKSRLKIVLIWSFLIIAFVGLVAAYEIYREFNQLIDKITPDENNPTVVGWEQSEEDRKYTNDPFAMVVIGMDSRPETGSINTDVLMLAVVEPETKKVTMLSLPRDTVVAIPGQSGYHKINEVYAIGERIRRNDERNDRPITESGTTLLKKTIEGMFGIPVKHYVQVDFNGFVKIIDELGGIEVDVERKLLYHDPTDGTKIDLEKGLQVLNGEQALGYVRHRMDDRGSKYYSSDFDRNRRQQIVVTKVIDKMKSFSIIPKINDILDIIGDHISTDFSREKIKGLAKDFIGFSSSDITILETGAYWDGHILKTVIPSDKLEEIQKTLWEKMKMTEEQGKARLYEENQKAVQVLSKQADKAAAERKAKEEKAKSEQATAAENPVDMNQADSPITEDTSSETTNTNSDTSNGEQSSDMNVP